MSRLGAIVHQRCPRCLEGRVFRGLLRMSFACPQCGLVFGRENGYFTGAMIVSYILAVPLLSALCLLVWRLTGWSAEYVILEAGLLFLPFGPALFRYSRVIWMHFDRLVDADPSNERYVVWRSSR